MKVQAMKMKNIFFFSLIIIPLLLNVSCAPNPRGISSKETIDQAFETSVPESEEAEKVKYPDVEKPKAALLSLKKPQVVEERFEVTANRAAAREFFMSLVQGTAHNMVVHPDVKGEVSLILKNVTVPEVLEVVSRNYGFDYRRTPIGYQIMPAGLSTCIFEVDYLNLTRKGVSQTRVSSGQVSETEKTSGNDDGEEKTQMVSGSRIDTESLADFWKELEVGLRTILPADAGRTFFVQPQAGLVVVRAFPKELKEVAEYLHAVQNHLGRQVILEAKILEVQLNDGFQSGIDWELTVGLGGDKEAVFSQSGGRSIFDDAASEIAGDISGGIFSLALDMNDFKAFIDLLQTQGDVQVLSSPRISTINNQKAVIKVGSDEFFVTDISSDTVTGTAATTSSDITLTPFFSGIALDVTPQIDSLKNVTLHIHPTISDVTDQNKLISVDGEEVNIPLAFSTVRESDSVVKAKSGQVVVIGGLMKDVVREKTASVPFLGELPVLGKAFRHTQMVSKKSELVILLRPMVLTQDEDWQRALEPSRNRFERMDSQLPQGW